MITRSEQDMIAFGKKIAKGLAPPTAIELIGDIGVGKTTLVKGIAKGLGVTDNVTSPSFTISKTYRAKDKTTILTHFDFYRLTEPGIMQEDLNESIADSDTITIVEWASAVKNILPKSHTKIFINYNNDNTRTIKVEK